MATFIKTLTFVNGRAQACTAAAPADADISFTDITTGNSATTQHGFLKKLDNTATHYMDGTGNWSTPAGSSPLPTRYIYGFPLAWSSSTHILVCSNATSGPWEIPSKCRDAADANDISIAAGTQININLGTDGAAAGNDSFAGAGTVSGTGLSSIVTGSGTSFFTDFGTRAGAQTITSVGNGVTGTNTAFLSEVAVGDMIGNATAGYAIVGAVISDTSLTLAPVAFPNGDINSASAYNIIEQPTITFNGTVFYITTISSNTSLIIHGTTPNVSGVTYRIGKSYGSAALNGVQYTNVHILTGGSGTTAICSTQRTKPYGVSFGGSSGISGYTTGYRRIQAIPLDSSGNIYPFAQDGLNARRKITFVFAVATNGTRVLSNGSASTWTDVACNTSVPPTARIVDILGTATGPQFSMRPRGVNAFSGQGISTVNGIAGGPDATFFMCCDGAQYIQYQNASASAGSYIDVQGYEEDV